MKSKVNPPVKPKLTVIDEVISSVNGVLLVTTSPHLGINIITPQKTIESGSYVEKIWKSPLKKLYKRLSVKKCLILGFGGGSAAKVIHNLWPDASVTGVEFDPIMIKLGKKYLKLPDRGVDIIISDAHSYVLKHPPTPSPYSLILVDVYIDSDIPTKFENRRFLIKLKSLISPGGFIIFNRIYTDNKKDRVDIFIKRIKDILGNSKTFSHQKNLFIVYKK